jgi:cytidylate kinase
MDVGDSLEDVRQQQHERDLRDSSRPDSPLQVARGAVVVDTTAMSLTDVVARLVEELEKRTDNTLDIRR